MLKKHITLGIIIAAAMVVNSQSINLRGKVSNSSGKPIPNAIVSLVRQNLKDTTGTDGTFSITRMDVAVLPILIPLKKAITMNNGNLEFFIPSPTSIKIELFDIKGDLLRSESSADVSTGFYKFDISKEISTPKLLIIRASIGKDGVAFRYIPLRNGKYIISDLHDNSNTLNNKLAKITAIDDSLTISATGYQTKSIVLSSYDQDINITLDNSGSTVGPSAGCGKDISKKTGMYTMTSAGLSRRYNIDIPANYDKNHPYRLIFGMHCMCGSMNSVRDEKFYMLKRIADSTKNYCIFVAPSAYASDYNNFGCTVWSQGEKDHIFFDELLKQLKNELCIDTTRVFSVGFSFGAMFTNSLAQNHQKVLRAVAVFAAANYNIYVPKNTGEPLAFMGSVGLSDGTCPPKTGRDCRDVFLKNNALNGVVTTETAKETTKGSRTYVVYDYKGVDPKYPVRWCTFDGDHQWAPVDGTSSGWDVNKTWTPPKVWEFFTQF